MTSETDQPEYGERATPEEQARAIEASGGVQPWQRRAEIPPPTQRVVPPGPDATRPTGYTANRFATVILLAIGLVAVLQSAFGYIDLGRTVQELYTQQGIGEYTETDLTRTIGIALVVSHALIWIITLIVSLRVLSRGKSAWWIPLVGAGVTFIIMATLLAALLLADPAFLRYLETG